MIVCTFAGHREVYHPGIADRVNSVIDSLVAAENTCLFLCGGRGEFDALCASAVRSAKRRNPQRDIRLALVLPYLSNRVNQEKQYYEGHYDQILVPEELAGIHYKAAITMCNRWMVDQADCVIAYVHRNFGGAANTVGYAVRKGKRVISIGPEEWHEL